MCANRSKSTGKWGLCYLAAVFCCDLFFAFYFRRQPGEAELVLMPQCTDPQEEGKCVCGGGSYMLVSSVTLCLCVRGKREGKREAVLAMLPSFLITSVSWCCPFLLPFHPLVLSLVVVAPLLFSPSWSLLSTPLLSLSLHHHFLFLSKTAHLLLYASHISSHLHATFSPPHSPFPLSLRLSCLITTSPPSP